MASSRRARKADSSIAVAFAPAALGMTIYKISFALRPGFRDLGQDFAFFFGGAAEVVFGEAVAQEFEGVFGGVDDFELVEILRRNGAGVDEGLEVQDACSSTRCRR